MRAQRVHKLSSLAGCLSVNIVMALVDTFGKIGENSEEYETTREDMRETGEIQTDRRES